MREIKFRAWDTKKNHFDYEPLISRGKCCFIDSFDNFEEHEEGRMVLQQYTGLKDKNGKEIHEGDFIKLPEFYETREATNETFTITGYIEFKDGAWMFSDSGFVYGEHTSYDGNFEVVGNIYENPELLEVSK